jgi:uncharacterized protein (DUF1015 family)
MATVRPFSAYRPASGTEHLVAALPYDVYNRKEAKEEVLRHPESFLAIDRAESQFPDSVELSDPAVYAKAAEMIRERIADGRFVRDPKSCFYLYELTMEGRAQTGIVGCASVEEYEKSIIRKHENTRADKELDRINHVDITGFQTGPIFLAYRTQKELSELTGSVKKRQPVNDFTSEDGIRHRVWIIDDEQEVEAVQTAFETVPNLYIADGHHRCASAVKVGQKRRQAAGADGKALESDYFLSVIFPDEELKILDYNRVVKDLNGLSVEEFLSRVRESFTVEKAPEAPFSPKEKGHFGMYLQGCWYELTAKEEIRSEDAVEGLDVSVLQDHLLGPILGIEDPKTDKRIDFVGGIRGLTELERRCREDMQVAFSMYPTTISELFAVADAGRLMPPKSTWFEPKLRSGLFLHSLDQ